MSPAPLQLLPCPFCGSAAVARWDGPEPRPFYVRCSRATCPGHNSVSFAEADVALAEWNRRVQLPPAKPDFVAHLGGFTTKNLIRGELVEFELDRTGVLTSDKMQFNPHSTPLMLRPCE
jgi:hypothetical protein